MPDLTAGEQGTGRVIGFADSATTQRVVLSCACVEGAVCVITRLFQSDIEAEQFDAIRELLPCSWCRQAQEDARALKGARLGKREREVLRQLPRWNTVGDFGWIVERNIRPRASREAYLRALRKLFRIGLAWLGRRRVEKRSDDGYVLDQRYFREAWLSPLGAEVVKRYSVELNGGSRIRWDNRLAEAAACCQHSVEELAARLADRAVRERGLRRELVQLAVQAGGSGTCVEELRRMSGCAAVVDALEFGAGPRDPP